MAEAKIRFKNDDGNDYPVWDECILDDVFEERNEAHLITDDAPQLAFTIEQGVIYPEDKKTNKRDFLMKDKSNKKFLLTEPDDIIYNPANLKFGAIHRNKLCRGVVSPIYAIFRTNQNPAFMEYVVRNPRFIKRSLKYLEGTVIKLMTLKPRDFVKMHVSIPCIEEQNKIAEFMGEVDSIIETSMQEVNKLKELKKGCLQKMFPKEGSVVPEVRFPGFTDDWEQRKLEDISANYKYSIVDGPFGSDLKTADYTEDGVLVMQSNYITGGKFEIKQPYFVSTDKAEQLSRCHCKGGDILIAKIGANFGICNLIPENIGDAVLSSNCMKVDLDEKHDNNFYMQYFNTLYESGFYYSLVGITAQPALSLKFMKSLEVPSPSIEEQQKIASFLENLDNLITLHQRECDKYKELKKGLLQQMFV